MAKEFLITDVVDQKAIDQLSNLRDNFTSTKKEYTSLVTELAKGIKINVTNYDELTKKAKMFEEAQTRLSSVEKELSKIQQEHQNLLKKIAEDTQKAANLHNKNAEATARSAKESENLSKANEEYVLSAKKVTKSLSESGDALNNIKNIRLNYSEQIEQISKYMQEIDRLKRNEKALETQMKGGLISREQYNQRLAEGKIAQKEYSDAIRQANKEIINSRKSEQEMEGSLISLRAQLSNLTKEYDSLSRAQRESAKGKELEESIREIQTELKEAENATGRFQREVGSYERAIESAVRKNIPFISTIKKMTEMNGGLSASLKAAGTAAMNFGKQLLVLLANPIVATIAAIVGAFVALKAVMSSLSNVAKSNEEQSSKLSQAMAPISVIGDKTTRSLEKLADVYIKISGAVTGAIAKLSDWLGITENLAEESEKYAKHEERKLKLAIESRNVNEENARSDAKISELRAKANEKDTYTAEERLSFIRDAQKEEEAIYERNRKIAEERLYLLEEEGERTKNSAEMNDKISKARIDLINIDTQYNNSMRELNRQESRFINEAKQAADAASKLEKEMRKLETSTHFDLVDSTLSLLEDNFDKRKAIINLNYDKEISSLKERLSSEEKLTAEAKDNINLIIINKENERIKAIQDLTEKEGIARRKINEENALYGLKESDEEWLNSRKRLLDIAMYEEIKEAESSGADVELIRRKYQEKDIELLEKHASAKNEIIQQHYTSESVLVNAAMSEELDGLAEQYSKGLISKEDYERKKAEITEKYAIKQAELAIELAREQLNTPGLSPEDRFKLEQQIANAEIALAGKVRDAKINALERTTKATEKDTKKTQEAIQAISDLLGGFADLGNAIFENKISQIEDEQDANDEAYDREIERIESLQERGAISTEVAEARKRAAEDKTRLKEEELARKKAALQEKQAKWDKSNNIIQTIMSTSLGIMRAMAMFPPNPVMAALIGAMGAIQLATIVAQPIPKYAKGTKDHPGGLAIVGDGGKKEGIFADGGLFVTPDKPTLVDLPRHAQVIPDLSFIYDRKGLGSDFLLLEQQKKNMADRGIVVNVDNDYSRLEKKMEGNTRQLQNINKLMKKANRNAEYNWILNRV